jgi:Ca-activated chloride channel family protein
MSFLLLLPLLLAQQEPLPIKVEVNLVNVTFTVRGTDGQLAGNLKVEDFEILEDGVPQEIKFFGRSTDLPLRLALVIDGSNSQSKFNRDHHKDVEKFLHASLTSRDQALLLGFGNHLRVACGFTSNVEELMASLTRYEKTSSGMPELDPDDTRSGGTAMFDAVYAVASQKLAGVSGERKAVVLFSDGEDNSSAHDVRTR